MQTEGMQRMIEDIGAEGQATLQNQLKAPLWKTITVTTSTAVQPRHTSDQCAFIQHIYEHTYTMLLCVNAYVLVCGEGRVELVRARSGDLIGAAAAGMSPEFQ